MRNKLMGGLAALLLSSVSAFAADPNRIAPSYGQPQNIGTPTQGAGVSTSVVTGVTVTGTPTNGQVLTATSGTAASWATPSGGGGSGGVPAFPYVSGISYYLPFNAAPVAAPVAVVGTIYCAPAIIPGSGTVSSLVYRVSTPGTTSGALALYSGISTSVGYRPGAPVVNTAVTADTSAALGPLAVVTPAHINAGIYFMCSTWGDTTVVAYGLPASPAISGVLGGTNGSSTGVSITGQTMGTWPTFTSANAWTIASAVQPAPYGFQFNAVP